MNNSNGRIDLNPKIWGPKAWFFIDSVIIGYSNNPSDKDKNIMRQFMLSLLYLLPCRKCRKKYHKHLEKHPLSNDILSSRKLLFKWFNNIHNNIRLSNKKNIIKLQAIVTYYALQYSIKIQLF